MLVVDATEGMLDADKELVALFKAKEIPFVVAFNKADIAAGEITVGAELDLENGKAMYVSALKKEGIFELKELIGKSVATDELTHKLVGDIIGPDDFVVLVVPIDSAAPKGRLILPQQQAIRDVLESGAAAIVVRESELEMALKDLGKKPTVVITDSQAFGFVSKIVPDDMYLTSFSILMARYKGFLKTALDGAAAVDNLVSGDKILISEGCTHHRQCDDIGTVKIPRWLKEHTGLDVYANAFPEGVSEGIIIETTSGTEFPEDVSQYKLVIHCGGCMLNEREIKYRMKCTTDQGVPFINYGIFIAYVHGILDRSVEIIRDKAGI